MPIQYTARTGPAIRERARRGDLPLYANSTLEIPIALAIAILPFLFGFQAWWIVVGLIFGIAISTVALTTDAGPGPTYGRGMHISTAAVAASAIALGLALSALIFA